jgi:hypothetical protein
MTKKARTSAFLAAVALLGLEVACGGGSSPLTGPAAPKPESGGGATIQGTLQSAAIARGDASIASVSGIRVSVVGTALAAMTDGGGHFTLSGVPAGRVQLRFEGPGTDARIEIELQDGQVLSITISVSGSSASMVTPEDGVKFAANIESIGAGSFVAGGRTVLVDTATRLLGSDNQTIPFSVLKPNQLVEVEGQARTDGSVLATKVKIEDNAGDDKGGNGDDDGQDVTFTGPVQQISPALIIGGKSVTTNGNTRYLDHKNQLVAASVVLKVGNKVEVEGQQSGSSVLAKKIKLED